MRRILIFAGRYLPGYKDGGPVRTLKNLTDLLGDEYDFRLVVMDRDHGDEKPYSNIKVNEWNQVGKANVWYYSPGQMRFSLIRKLAKDSDLIYLCGFYGNYGYKTLILNRFRALGGKPVVVAAMGNFTKGALSQKSVKKKGFIRICSALGLFRNIRWSVSSDLEKKDTQRIIGENAKCVIAEDLPRSEVIGHNTEMSEAGRLNVAFIARICKHKNLLYLIDVLEKVKGNITLTIGGAIEDEEYWDKCRLRLDECSGKINWKYVGEVDSEKIPTFFAGMDALLLPTLGENYCHVVFEALSAGCIPVISDQTPWGWIQEYGCGYVIPLDRQDVYVTTIQTLAELSKEEKQKLSEKAVQAAEYKLKKNREYTGYRDIFGEG